MPTLIDLTGKDYLSNSSMSQWLRCPESFFHERIVGRRSGKSWAMLAGLAIHSATEALDTGQETDVQQAWDNAWAFRLSTIEANEVVRAGGRSSKEWPGGEDAAFWTKHGPVHVANWVAWRDARLGEGWQMLSVEQGFRAELGGITVLGSIDRLLSDQHGQQIVLDLKSGQAPKSPTQLAIYAAALEVTGEARPVMGGYFLTKTGSVDMLMLDRFTADMVGSWFAGAARGIEAEIFPPNPSNFCSACGVRQHCSVFGDRT
jgi:hypothetical protein